jgi:hypothetical protein
MEDLPENVQLQDREEDRCESVSGSKGDALRALRLSQVIQKIVLS